MNIIFMGTPDFAVPCLERLLEKGHHITAVFSQPDKPKGRGYTLTPPPVKSCALARGIPVYQPESLKNGNALEIIDSLIADIIIVVAYGKILPKEILTAKKYGCVNVHASLLPKYRGAAPIQWAVMNGESKTGVTIMQMDEGLDTGDMLLVRETDIGVNETAEELFSRLSVLGADALADALYLLENDAVAPVKQDTQSSYFYARMIDKSLCEIDWRKSAFEIHNQIRALASWPVAFTTCNGKKIKVHSSVLSERTGKNKGEVVDVADAITVCCGDQNCIEITEVQLEGKKRMKAADFLRGNKIEKGIFLGG